MAINVGIMVSGSDWSLSITCSSTREDLTFVAINDLLEHDYIAYLFQIDSTTAVQTAQ